MQTVIRKRRRIRMASPESTRKKKKLKNKKKKKKKEEVMTSPLPPSSSSHAHPGEEQQENQQPQVPDSASPASKRKRILVFDGEASRADPFPAHGGGDAGESVVATTTTTPGVSSAKRPGSKWGEAEQITLMKEMVGYTVKNGPCKLSIPYMAGFRSALPEDFSIRNFSEGDILEKMKDIKKIHAHPIVKERKPYILEVVRLAVNLWGEAGRGTVQKGRKVIEEVETREVADNDDDGSRRVGGGGGHGVSFWEDSLVDFVVKMFSWTEDQTRGTIPKLDRSARDSVAAVEKSKARGLYVSTQYIPRWLRHCP